MIGNEYTMIEFDLISSRGFNLQPENTRKRARTHAHTTYHTTPPPDYAYGILMHIFCHNQLHLSRLFIDGAFVFKELMVDTA